MEASSFPLPSASKASSAHGARERTNRTGHQPAAGAASSTTGRDRGQRVGTSKWPTTPRRSSRTNKPLHTIGTRGTDGPRSDDHTAPRRESESFFTSLTPPNHMLIQTRRHHLEEAQSGHLPNKNPSSSTRDYGVIPVNHLLHSLTSPPPSPP